MSVEGYSNPNIHFQKKDQDGYLQDLTTEEIPEALKEVDPTADIREIVTDVHESVPNIIEGLNLQRIDSYMQKWGEVSTSPVLYIDEDGVGKLHRALLDHGMKSNQVNQSDRFGEYWPVLDLIYIKRMRELEEANGVELTEAFSVHERIHRASQYPSLYLNMTEKTRKMSKRTGLSVNGDDKVKRGTYLEEGLAQLGSIYYLISEAGLPAGTLGGAGVMQSYEFGKLVMPRKYGYRSASGSYSIPPSSAAAYGLELLCTEDPSLLPLLIKSRGDISLISEIIARLNQINPKLYSQLRTLEYSAAGFGAGTSYIIGTLFDGDQSAAADLSSSNPLDI